jgi:probable DNA repair protein
MGAWAASEFDAWLREGGLVVTASDRAARALVAAFHRARQAEGLTAWPAPNILDWNGFVRTAWLERASTDNRLMLNSAQETALWVDIAGEDPSLATVLEGPRHRLAALAMEAHELLCSHAPRFLDSRARRGWQQDAEAFSRWLSGFDEACRAGSLLSTSRLPLELIPLLNADAAERPPLLLAGFDRIPPVQRSLFDAWGVSREAAQGDPAAEVHFHAAADTRTELAACALWCGRQLAANPDARLLVVAQAASARRGEIERAFLRLGGSDHGGSNSGPLFEFSLGVPLRQVALARAAHLALRWLCGPLQEQELDWLLSTDHLAADARESAGLEAFMRTLRRRGQQRTHWTLGAFIGQRTGSNPLPASWVERMVQAQRGLQERARRPQSPLEWAELVPRLLGEIHFASSRPLQSAEFQAVRRWSQAVEAVGSLGFDGRRMAWADFLAQLGRGLDETLFAPESRQAPIQIAGPAESAGLGADAVWFLGADEDTWPAGGSTHPLLPVEVQREAGMPHATALLDWELARSITNRLLASAPEAHFSFARQNEAAEAGPSRLIVQLAGAPTALPPELAAERIEQPMTVRFEDFSRIPFPPGKAPGGSSVLTAQSQCAFKAFATARLAAQGWEAAEAGLTASERGSLLHSVLHAVWAGKPEGIRSQHELLNLDDRQGFVAGHVHRALERELRPHLCERMPRRYLELEEQRLTRLVSEWLGFEATRVAFEVAATEVQRSISVAGLILDLRLDRIDRLSDGSELVIDYKSGDVSPTSWDLPRPDDVQLPLYAGFALDEGEELGGLVFAKVRPGDLSFAGNVADARGTLLGNLPASSSLVRDPFTVEKLLDWRDSIEQLARDFLSGKAEVDPRDYPRTCERCGLQSLCRIQEHRAALEAEDDDGEGGND